MAEIVLYRKYRPQKFSEVIGQEHIVGVLEGALRLGRVTHAYLFAGSRGTGKTSVARILAREMGCLPMDLYEIDGASNRGIDEVRALREAVRTYPFESPVKVYIIDEVHMLTKEAFNALLKTLEEPPEHVVFVLATTELHRVPETIISRCQSFVFRRPNLAEVRKLLESVARSERFALEPRASELIALLADGSFRDAVGILQKAISVVPPPAPAGGGASKGGEQKITGEVVEAVTGAPAPKLINDFARALLERDTGRALEIIKELVSAHTDLQVFIKLVLRPLRQALIWRLAPEQAKEIKKEATEEELALLVELRDHSEAKRLPEVLRALLETYDQIPRAFISALPLELMVVRLGEGEK